MADAASTAAGNGNKNAPGCNRGLTDSGKTTLGSIMQAAAIIVAGLNTKAALDMADKQYDISKQYLDIAKWWREYYYSTYAPWEDQELNEAWALSIEQPLYDNAVGRARTFVRLHFKGLAEKSIQCTSEYCTGLREALLKDVMESEATALASASALGYRNERSYVEARNDTRWQRRFAVIKRGRDMMADNIQFAQLAYGIYGDLGKQAMRGAAGAVGYLGYTWNRNETKYPTTRRGVPTQRKPLEETPIYDPASYEVEMQEQPKTVWRSGVEFPVE